MIHGILAEELLAVWDDAGWGDGCKITRAEIQLIAEEARRLTRERDEAVAALEEEGVPLAVIERVIGDDSNDGATRVTEDEVLAYVRATPGCTVRAASSALTGVGRTRTSERSSVYDVLVKLESRGLIRRERPAAYTVGRGDRWFAREDDE